MTRSSWRLSIWSSGLAILSFTPLMFSKINARTGLDVAVLAILVLVVLANAVRTLYLLRVRRRYTPFWEEEEASRVGPPGKCTVTRLGEVAF